MPQYREKAVSGITYRRWLRAVIQNPPNGALSIGFEEQDVAAIDGKIVNMGVSMLTIPFDAEGVVPLLDLITGLPTGGTITQVDAAQILFSLYADAANKRDNPPAPPSNPLAP